MMGIKLLYIFGCTCLFVWSLEASSNCDIDRTGLPTDTCTFDLLMKNAKPNRADQYMCSGYSVKDEILPDTTGQTYNEEYIVKFEALADAGTAHHILVFGCERAYRTQGSWNCGTVCEGKEQIIFAWAKNAPPLSLPKNVGRRIGSDSQINHIVIQVHYSKALAEPDTSGIRIYTTHQRQQFLAGIYLLLAYDVVIPPNTEKTHADISCRFNWPDSIVPFGYRTHAHTLGKVISGYKVAGNDYQLIGKGNPQWPQAFYPVENPIQIQPGDMLAARCTFNSIGRNRKTYIGSTSDDEMCNFYIMYYTNATSEGQGPDTCAGNNIPQVFNYIPADSDTPLPPNPDLENVAHSHHHHTSMPAANEESEQHNMQGKVMDTPPANQNIKGNTLSQAGSGLGLTFKSAVGTFDLGQVAGLAVGKTGDLYIFHRGEIVWNSLSFDLYGNYQYKDKPVDTDAIVVVNKDGNLVRSFGKNMFYLPHGLTLDDKDNVWVTDVGLHQVFRLPRGQDKPDLTLGIRFEPGTDTEHFCKPSDVAVLSSGDFFVSDGYCNTRIMKFDKNGYFLQQWGKPSTSYGLDNYPLPGMFNLPHSLALAEDKNLLCVADRENGRIQCFNLNGTFMRQMHPAQIGETLYAVEYSPNHGGILFAVNGRSLSKDGPPVQGLTFDINNGVLLSTWNIPSKGLSNPHDVTVDDSRHLVYVGELNPTKVWKFEMDHSLYAANNSKTIVPTKPAESHTNAPVITDSGIGVTQLLSSKKTSTAKSVGVVSDDPIVSGSSIDVVLNAGIVQSPTVEKMEEDNFAPSLVIGMLLVVPVILLVAITVLIRLYHTGYFRSCNRRSNLKSKFNLGNFLNSHKGFDRLSTEDDDHDLDNALDDSDNEEFSIVRKA